MKKISQVKEVATSGKLKIHRNLSYEEYFSTYSRDVDGLAILATYSFNAHAFNDFNRLMPFSKFFIAKKKKRAAIDFVRRFPLYVVYLVPELHTKACWFERSRKMLIGSENIYDGKSDFEELSCEFVVSESDAKEMVDLAFDIDTREYLRVKYDASDIAIYPSNCQGVVGKAFLPCHKEIEYWSRISSSDEKKDGIQHYIYCILEYKIKREICYLAFDRYYQFCGELSLNAFAHINNILNVRKQKFSFLESGVELKSSAPLKDYFTKFHPIAQQNKPIYAHYV